MTKDDFPLDSSARAITPSIALCCVRLASSCQAGKTQAVEAIKASDEPKCAVAFSPSLALF
jgi:hypothetical protein